MDLLNYDARRFFLLGMRFFFGIWLLYAGLVKFFVITPNGVVAMITKDFDATWSPHQLNVGLAWLIMIAEVILPALLLSGWKPRLVWTATSLLMFLLLFGQSMLMKGDVAPNWFYTLLVLACAALSDPLSKPKAE